MGTNAASVKDGLGGYAAKGLGMAGYDKKMVRDHVPGWVYLFSFPLVNEFFFKIGLSRKPFQRINQLSKEDWTMGCVMIAASFWTDDMAKDEDFLIECYKEHKTRDGNEYFYLPPDTLDDFIRTVTGLAREARYRSMRE